MDWTRRYFLRSTGAAAAYLGLSPLTPLSSLIADASTTPVTKGKTLVVIFLRGGADGLNLVVPFGDPAYRELRPNIHIPAPGSGGSSAVDLDGFFGLHPRLSPLVPFFESGLARAVHAVGYDENTRSHFEEQDVWETGIVGNTIHSDGWLNRHLATSRGQGEMRAVAIGDTLPRILRGDVAAYALRGLEDVTLTDGGPLDSNAVTAALERAYGDPEIGAGDSREAARELLSRKTRATLSGLEGLRNLAQSGYQPRHPYPETQLGRRLEQVARLIKADVGLEVAEVDFGGWDTHRNQGRGAGGTLGNLAGQLASALASFTRDLEDRMDDVLVATLTDFGRTAAENGSAGTDHGWANSLFLLGGPVEKARSADMGKAAGPVKTQWPGLDSDSLHQGRDLLHTIDFRDVLAELVRVHLGNPNLEKVLPNHEFNRLDLIR